MPEKEFFCDAFADYLRQYNLANSKRPITQSRLARILDVCRATITNWIKGRSTPGSRQVVLNIASALKLDRVQADHLLRLCEYALTTDGEAQKLRGGDIPPRSNLLAPIIKERCPDFRVERTALLAEMRQMIFAPTSPNNLVVQGIGGSGKTVLVAGFLIQSEAQLVKTFQDGVVWIDLENSLIDPWLQIRHQLGLTVPFASAEELRQSVMIHALALKPLWVIDGCETMENAVPWLKLVRASRGKFIITLQEQPDPGWLSQQRAKLLHVGNLDAVEGLHLAENILQVSLPENEFPEWEKLANLVSYHPLAIRILAGCAFFDPTAQRWKNLLAALHRQGTRAIQLGNPSPEGDKNSSAHRCLQIGYERLHRFYPSSATCFRALGILSGCDFAQELVSQLIDPGENFGRLMAILVQAGLVEFDRNRNAYRMHRLLHLFARTLLLQNPAEYTLVGTKYLTALRYHLPSIPEEIDQAVCGPFLSEYAHAIEMTYQAGQVGDALNFLNRTYRTLLGIGRSDQVIQSITTILPAFAQYDQLKGEPLAWLSMIHGDTLLFRQDVAQALSQYEQVLVRSQNPLLLFRTHLQRALCDHILDKPGDVYGEIARARELLEILPDEQRAPSRRNYWSILQQIAIRDPDYNSDRGASFVERVSIVQDLFEQDRFSEGCRLLETLDAAYKSTPLITLQGDVLQMLAYGYMQQGQHEKALQKLDHLEKVLHEAPDSPDLRLLWAQLWQYRGWYHLEQTNLPLAHEYLNKSLEIWKTIPGSNSIQDHILALLRDITGRLEKWLK